MKIVAFIPLRAGGSRVGLIDGRDKERAFLGDHALMAYTIRAAIDSNLFDDVIAIVNSEPHAAIARSYGASVPWYRPEYTTNKDSPDIEWVNWALKKTEYTYDAFSILRVTSPFRGPDVIRDAWTTFYNRQGADSLRMVRLVSEHPGKMWVIRDDILLPLLPMGERWHSRPTQSLFKAYIQTAGMEFAWCHTVFATGSIAGSVVVPYVTDYWTGFDINTREDWNLAKKAVSDGKVRLPKI